MLHGNHLGYTRGAIAHLAKPFMTLPKEWARGSSVCRASTKGFGEGGTGLAAHMHTGWGSRWGGRRHPTMKVKGGSLPQGPHWPSRQPVFSHLHDISLTLGAAM